MVTALDLVAKQGSGGRAARGAYHAYHPTLTLTDNLNVFRALVWRDYMRRDCLALADQIRSGLATSWDAWIVGQAIWQHMVAYPYIAPPAGEELYLDFPGFMARGGGDCDNKTLIQCCLALASGVRCRAVVIELATRSGVPSGDGHMYAEMLIPGRGWVAFDASKDHPMPGSPGHQTHGFRRAVVDFSGNRPQEAAIMSALSTAGYVDLPMPANARLLTGMLRSGSACVNPGVTNDRAKLDAYMMCEMAADAEAAATKAAGKKQPPTVWDSVWGRGQEVAAEGLLGGFSRTLAKYGLGPEPTGGAGDLIAPLLLAGLVIGGIVWWRSR